MQEPSVCSIATPVCVKWDLLVPYCEISEDFQEDREVLTYCSLAGGGVAEAVSKEEKSPYTLRNHLPPTQRILGVFVFCVDHI